LTAPIRRFGPFSITRFLVVAIGLSAFAAFTMPDLQKSAATWLSATLWCCLAYFAVEAAARSWILYRNGAANSYFSSALGVIDCLTLFPVPLALLCGVTPPTAWLLASLWVLKLAQNSSSLEQLRRVFVLEAKPLASVFALFLIVLWLSAAGMYLLERDLQPSAFGTMPGALWWAVVTLTGTGYGDVVPQSHLGHLLGAFVMISGIGTLGLWTGILATGYAAETRRRKFIQTWDLVSRVPFFQSLDPATITEITHLLRHLEVPERTAIIRRGKVGDCMYFIAAGEVQVDVKPKPVRLGAGAFFGEIALLGDAIRTVNVTTTMSSTLLILDLADFRTLTANHPDLKRAIDDEGHRRMQENQAVAERRPGGDRATQVPSDSELLPS
jgi:voltage-gated potassium channel